MTEPTDAELETLFVEETGFAIDDFPAAITIDFARAVLAKWGTPAVAGEPVTPFIPAQRERLYYNRPENVGKDASLADWHRIVQYIEAAHGIKGGQHG